MLEPDPEMRIYGTRACPIRMSSLPMLSRCPGFVMLRDRRFYEGEDRDSKAANTGTAVGRAVELYHRGLEMREALDQVKKEKEQGARGLALADLARVDTMADRYARDPRNPYPVVIESSLELEVKLELPPWEHDPTREPIYLVGHVDQIRRCPKTGGAFLWDVKAGRVDGLDMVYEYAWQQAAYCLASTETLGEQVLMGGIIRMQDYLKLNPGPAFYFSPWTPEQLRVMMETVRQHVAWLRAGVFHLHPGKHCSWCPAGGPHLCAENVCNVELVA